MMCYQRENEFNRIFVSSMSSKKHYKEIVEFLAKYRFRTRGEILKNLGLISSAEITDILNDLGADHVSARSTLYLIL